MRFGIAKFKGKPKELQDFLKNLCEEYGKNNNLISLYIVMGKEWDIRNEQI